MKSYICKLLRNANSNEAKKLLELFWKYHKSFIYTEANSFECFYIHIPADCPHYDFFHEYETKGEQCIDGTPIHWRVLCYNKLQIWLA